MIKQSKNFAQWVSILLQPGKLQIREELSMQNFIKWNNDPETHLEEL